MEIFNICFRATQCYSCFKWCDHLRNECPIKYDSICSRCSNHHGHSYTQCNADFKCANCRGSHPATARICPEYSAAIEKHLPVIVAQLTHLINSIPIINSTPSDKAIGTDILRAATLNSKNKDEFLTSLYESCKIFNDNLNQEHTDFLEDSYSSLNAPEAEEIITKDTSLDNTMEELNKEVLLATKNKNLDIHETIPPCPYFGLTNLEYPTALSSNIPHYIDCQYGLTNNGIETIESIEENISQYALCKLKSPKYDETPPNIYIQLYMQISPYQNIVFYNPQNQQKIALKPEIIDNLKLCENTITFNTFDYGAYELIFNEEHIYSRSSAKKLALWLNSHYNLKLTTR